MVADYMLAVCCLTHTTLKSYVNSAINCLNLLPEPIFQLLFHAVSKVVLLAIFAIFSYQAVNVGFKPRALRVELA